MTAFATPAFQVACWPRAGRFGPKKRKATRQSIQRTELENCRRVHREFMRRLLGPFAPLSPTEGRPASRTAAATRAADFWSARLPRELHRTVVSAAGRPGVPF